MGVAPASCSHTFLRCKPTSVFCILRCEVLFLSERMWAYLGDSLRLWRRNKTLRNDLRAPSRMPGQSGWEAARIAGAPRRGLTRKGWRVVTPASLATEQARVLTHRPSGSVCLPGCLCRLAITAGSRRRLRSLSLCPSGASASEMRTCSARKII